MSARIEIQPEQFNINPFHLWSTQWLLLTAGDYASGQFNMMTVGWGYIGVMWAKPTAMVIVRSQRYTTGFLENGDSFTLTAFSEEYRNMLKICGSKSGRDIDKVKETGLTPEASCKIAAPGFKEAELVLECKKLYRDEFRKDSFLNPMIPKEIYAAGDFHIVYIGEILRISGTEKFIRSL